MIQPQRTRAPSSIVCEQAGQILAEGSEAEKIAVLASHPLIGANPAKGMSATSQKEQSSGGVDPDTITRLGELNTE